VNCSPSVADGCETQLGTMTNCGACGDTCSAPNTTATCDQSTNPGTCSYSCVAGFANCNGTMSDGCEIDTQTDNNNCGSCGHVCPPGTTCQQGSCIGFCPAGPAGDCSHFNSCSGHGCCTSQSSCNCDEPWSGAGCTDRPTIDCSTLTTCAECLLNAASGCVY